MRYGGSISDFSTNSSISIVRVDLCATSSNSSLETSTKGFPVQCAGLHDALIRDFPTGVGIDFQIFDAVAGPTVELIEGNLLAFGRHDRASDEGKT
jgi:hypothetical protein